MLSEPTKVLVHRHVWEIKEEDLIGSNGTVIDPSAKKLLRREEWQEGKPDVKLGISGSNLIKLNATLINKTSTANVGNERNMSAATVNSTITVVAITNLPSNSNTSTTSTVSPNKPSFAPFFDADSMVNATATKISSVSLSTSTIPTTLIVPSTTTASTNKPTLLSPTSNSTLVPATTNLKLTSSPLTLAPRPPPPKPTVYGQDLLPIV